MEFIITFVLMFHSLNEYDLLKLAVEYDEHLGIIKLYLQKLICLR